MRSRSAGLGPVGFVHGDHHQDVREDAKADFTEGALPILLASGIFATGVNLPAIQVLVNAGGWKAEGITAQKLGRGLRLKPFEGLRDRLVVLDPYDMAVDLVERHAKGRKRAYEKRGYAVHVGPLGELLVIAGAYLARTGPPAAARKAPAGRFDSRPPAAGMCRPGRRSAQCIPCEMPCKKPFAWIVPSVDPLRR